MWERYCRGVSAIFFVIDTADEDWFDTAGVVRLEIILSRPALDGIPVLVLPNKSDLPGAFVLMAVMFSCSDRVVVVMSFVERCGLVVAGEHGCACGGGDEFRLMGDRKAVNSWQRAHGLRDGCAV